MLIPEEAAREVGATAEHVRAVLRGGKLGGIAFTPLQTRRVQAILEREDAPNIEERTLRGWL